MNTTNGSVDLEPVPQSAVVRHWLRSESDAAAVGRTVGPVAAAGTDETLPAPDRVEALSDAAALDALLTAKPGAAGFLSRREPVAWYRTAVDADRFPALKLIESPEGMLWRALAPDRSPVTAARTVVDSDPAALARTVDVDARRILAIRRSLDDEPGPASPFVVRTRRGRAPWTIVDGNHRAVARAIALLDETQTGRAGDATEPPGDGTAGTVEFPPQPVYLGVLPNPVARPARERLGGFVRRLLGREPAPV
ncbi:hypothetical protein ACFQH6_16195 [Halobacteriaceae archaeon GCM10025711]